MMSEEFIVIIRPSFKRICGDACRAAVLNHLLFRIAYKCKDQPSERIQAGEVLWYATTEQMTSELADAWGTCKVRKEVNELVSMGLIGRTKDPVWGVNRTKHFYFGQEQCARLLQLCEEHNICVVHLDLPPEVVHLIYSSNANDKSIKCTCPEGEANDKSIGCIRYIYPMQMIDSSLANDKSIEAITKKDYKDNNKEIESGAAIADTTATAPPAVVEDGPKEQETPTKPKRTRTRKPAVEMTEEERTRVDAIFVYLDQLRQEVTRDPEEHYRRDRDAQEAVLQLLHDRKPTQERLRKIFLDMWNAPRDPKTGFYWRDNMTISAICKQYERKSMALVASEKKQQLDTTRTQPGSGYRIVSTDEAEQAGGMRVLTRQERDAQRNRGRTAVL